MCMEVPLMAAYAVQQNLRTRGEREDEKLRKDKEDDRPQRGDSWRIDSQPRTSGGEKET